MQPEAARTMRLYSHSLPQTRLDGLEIGGRFGTYHEFAAQPSPHYSHA